MEYEIKEIEEFPDKLSRVSSKPKKLYAIGNLKLLYEDCFGIVGTRRVTEYGKEVCEKITKELVFRNIPVISGMAIGVDEIAHRTALDYRGKTIAVLASGFKYVYPEDNKVLFEEIIKNNGLVLSEYPPDTKKSSEKFPKRNRIIAALSEGVLVVEASKRSGSGITAKWARKYNKNVFAIPGKINDKMSEGTNELLKEFAILTTDIVDILKCYPQFENRKRISIFKKIEKSEKNFKIREDFKEIYNCLRCGEKTLEEIQLQTQIEIRILLKKLTEMELLQIIIRNSKQEYKICKD